jgi:hypothetical protein
MPFVRSSSGASRYRDLEAHNAALSALQAVWPLPDREGLEVGKAIYYAGDEHGEWF